MSSAIIANLEKLLDGPRDSALLRYSLGNEHLKAGDFAQAAGRLREALARDANYSAAWKLLGKALEQGDRAQEALTAYERGIIVAEGKGDVQAAREMRIFARRVQKQLPTPDD